MKKRWLVGLFILLLAALVLPLIGCGRGDELIPYPTAPASNAWGGTWNDVVWQ